MGFHDNTFVFLHTSLFDIKISDPIFSDVI